MKATPTKPQVIRAFLWLRRAIRKEVALQEQIFMAVRNIERQAALLKQASPIDSKLLSGLRDQAASLRENQLTKRRLKLAALGEMLMNLCRDIDAVTTFNERCDLLLVNDADRCWLTPGEDAGTIIVMGFEESSTYRHKAELQGPLAIAQAEFLAHWVINTQEGRTAADHAFEDVFGDIIPLPGERRGINPDSPPDMKPTLH